MQRPFVGKLKDTTQVFGDMSLPISKRMGYLEGNPPIVPVYVVRQVGIQGADQQSQDNFYNDVFELDGALEKAPAGYARIDGHLSMPENKEIDGIVSALSSTPDMGGTTLQERVLKRVVGSRVLERFVSKVMEPNVIDAFSAILNLYVQNERNPNESKIENFSVKILAWFSRYPMYQSMWKSTKDIPKVLFYGDIKAHEVYFLIFLSLIGTDVLYVHTDKSKDVLFDQVDVNGEFTKRHELPTDMPIESFPQTGRLIRKTTVAYQASQQIEEVLYSPEMGMFKPWQHEKDMTKAVTLKTTYEELKILWNEEARLRPEFEVRDDKVYVPNFFAKVNGTTLDLSEYAQDMKSLTSAEHTLFVRNFPFVRENYTKQELYSTAFLFNQDGSIDKETLQKSNVYKLQYLKDSIQTLLVYKINELIASHIFQTPVDEKMRLKILMTVINLDTPFLQLVEAFDFTGRPPKIVLYMPDRTTLTEDEAITLAFFNLLGADIVVFTPTNYNNVEEWFMPGLIATHQLPSVQFDLEFDRLEPHFRTVQAKGFWKKLFG